MGMPRVLIFEDDADILDLCRMLLVTRGYDPVLCTDAADAVERVRSAEPHVILMDNRLPSIAGTEAIALIKAQPDLANIPIVFFTANDRGEALAEEAGADFLIAKPFDIAHFLDTVSRALQSRGGEQAS